MDNTDAQRLAPATPHDTKRVHIALLILFLAIGVFLRTYRIEDESPWVDEVLSIQNLDAYGLVEYLRLQQLANPPMPQGYFFLLYYWSQFVSDTVVGYRLLSILAGILTMLLLFRFTRRLYGPNAACVAVACLAFAKSHIYYSQEIRPYALMALFALASAYTLYEALEGRGPRWWLLHFACNILLLWMHTFSVLFLFTIACFLLALYWRRRVMILGWFLAHESILWAFMPWVFKLDFDEIDSIMGWVKEPTFALVLDLFSSFFGGSKFGWGDGLHSSFVPFPLENVLGIILLLLTLRITLGVIRAAWRGRKKPGARQGAYFFLLVLWLLLPPMLAVILSYVNRPCFVERYLLYSSLPLYILVGAGFARLRTTHWQTIIAVSLAVLYGYFAVGLKRPLRGDWRAAAAFIQGRQEEGIRNYVVVFSPSWDLRTFLYNSDIPENHIWPVDGPDAIDDATYRAWRSRRIVWVLFPRGHLLDDPESQYASERFEAFWTTQGIMFARTQFPGYSGTVLYLLTPPERPPSPGISLPPRKLPMAPQTETRHSQSPKATERNIEMTSRERVVKTLEFDRPDRAPRDLWALMGVSMFRDDELKAILERFPGDFAGPTVRYGQSSRAAGSPGQIGQYTDEWGCVWTVAEPGVVGEVKNPPIENWAALDSFKAPWELLDGADFSETNASCAASDKFVKGGGGIRPFERLQFLRGTENLLMDLAYQPRELFTLRDMVHEYFLKEAELWAPTDIDGFGFMDDWGTQNALLISPQLWREFFKPLYKDYCDVLKKAGKYVFFHTDGHTRAIIPDLIEIGIDAINTQLFCMDIEELGRAFKGKITIWGEICRQNILPFGTVDQVREAVRRVRRAFDDGTGGVIAQCEMGIRDPKENVEAVFKTWLEPLPGRSG